jgi:hypothetical protein
VCKVVRGGERRYTGRMKIRSALFTLVFIGVCSSAMAQWQWLDKDGRRVFSDRPPPTDIPEKSIIKRPGGAAKAPEVQSAAPADGQASAPAKAAAPSGDKELEAKKKQIEKQAADADAAKRKAEEDRIAKAKAENCSRARTSLDTINSGVRISTVNSAGEKVILDDAARASERARVQSVVDSDCR